MSNPVAPPRFVEFRYACGSAFLTRPRSIGMIMGTDGQPLESSYAQVVANGQMEMLLIIEPMGHA